MSTLCVGLCASMASVLLAAGAEGKRFSLPNSSILIHQPSGGAQGQAADIEIAAREILRWQDRIRQVLADHTKQPYERIARDIDRDYYMTAEQALEYGLVDEVFRKPVPASVDGAQP